MKLYVIRHGRTQNNDSGIFNGRFDEDINETGIKQAEEASKKIKDLSIDLIICSPLLRTRHTANIVNVNNIPIITNDLLMERDYGSLQGKPVKCIDKKTMWQYKKNACIEGLEETKDIYERVKKCLTEIKQKYGDKNILIVTHNGVARCIYAYFYGIPANGDMSDYGSQDNCEIKEYDW